MKARNSRGPADNYYFVASCYGIMLLALFSGVYFRLKGLDKAPFAIDEYYIATSVKNILEHGLPQFDCGGFYVRGLLLQYIAAPFFKYGSHDEFYFRLITVFFNLVTIPALYLLGKQVAGRTVACLVVTLFCLSIWEIEFARFARMYSPFQAMFVWYLVFLYRAMILEDTGAKKWMHIISFASIFVFEGGIFLVLLNFLPFVVNGNKNSPQEIVLSTLILILAYAYISHDFRHLGVGSYLPADISWPSNEGGDLPIELPVMLAPTLTSNLAWTLIFLVLLVICLVAIWRLFASRHSAERTNLTRPQSLLVSLLILLSLFNLYGLLVYLTVLAFLLGWLNLQDFTGRSLRPALIAILLAPIFWVCYGLLTDEWYALLETRRHSQIRELFVVFLKYPDTYTKIFLPWFRTMPLLTIAAAALVSFGLLEARISGHNDRKGYLLVIAILLGLSVLTAALKQPYVTIRYTFFLYPLVLLVVITSLKRLARLVAHREYAYRVLLVSFVMIFAVLSEDFGIAHLRNIDSDRVVYRIGFDRFKRDQYYRRWDYRTLAKIINENMEPDDIIVSTVNVSAYYLRRLDHFYVSHRSPRLRRIAGCGGKKDLWTNANLVYKQDALLNLLQKNESTIWLIVQSDRYGARMDIEKKIAEVFSPYRIFQSVDGHLDVYKITATKDRDFRRRSLSNI